MQLTKTNISQNVLYLKKNIAFSAESYKIHSVTERFDCCGPDLYTGACMDKITRWIFACIAAVLLVYACVQYRTVQTQLQNAQNCLVELRETAQQLKEENDHLRGADTQDQAVQPPESGEDIPGEE